MDSGWGRSLVFFPPPSAAPFGLCCATTPLWPSPRFDKGSVISTTWKARILSSSSDGPRGTMSASLVWAGSAPDVAFRASRRNHWPERPMSGPWPCFCSMLVLLALVGVFPGCATFSSHLGIRPSEPTTETKASPCDEYGSYSKYAQDLQEAYHSRASQNRGWIYVAGILGLGVAAASGGLAAATAVSAGTLGLL